jgi:hypothetical protein
MQIGVKVSGLGRSAEKEVAVADAGPELVHVQQEDG